MTESPDATGDTGARTAPGRIDGDAVPEETRAVRRAAGAPGIDPFAPAGVEFRGVSANLAKVRLLGVALWVGLPFAATTVAAVLAWDVTGWWIALVPAALLLVGLWLVWLVPRQVRAIGYALTDQELLIRKGIMFRTLVVVPYGRLQYVDVGAGPLDRLFRIAGVQLHTASAATDADLPGLPTADAARLRDRLSEAGEAQLAGL